MSGLQSRGKRRKKCCWMLSEGAETTRQAGIEIEVDRWKEKHILERTCSSEWMGNINFIPGIVALLFSWSGLKQCFMKHLNFSSHLNLSPCRKAARGHTRSACQVKVWKWRRVCRGYCGIHKSMLLHDLLVGWFNKEKISPSFFFQKCLSLYTLTKQNRAKEC